MNTKSTPSTVVGYLKTSVHETEMLQPVIGDKDGNAITFHHLTLVACFSPFPEIVDGHKFAFLDLDGEEVLSVEDAKASPLWRDDQSAENIRFGYTPMSAIRLSRYWEKGVYYLRSGESAHIGTAQKVWPQASRVGRWREQPQPGEKVIGELLVRPNDPAFPVFSEAV